MTDEQTIADEALAFVLENLRTYTTRDEGTAEKILADFAPAISFIPVGENQEVQGIDEMEAFVRREFEQHPFAIEIDVLWTKVKVLREALAVVELATNMQFSETVAMQLRGTFVCEKRQGRWWIVNLRGSLPAQATPDELWPVEVLRARNAELERQVAEHTAKLEAAHREAQIEAALERVRARSLAMRHSDELADVSVVLFEQLKALGLIFDLTCVCIMDEQSDTLTVWPTDLEGGLVSRSFAFPLNEDPMGKKMYQAWQQWTPEARKGHVMVMEYVGRDLQELLEWFSMLPDDQDDATTQHYRETPESVTAHDTYFSHGWLSILSVKPFDAAELDILKRFAGVFEQAYVRFLDLKQAEEQAREARIEAALERIRAKALAMHSSDDLASAIKAVFEELHDLGIDALRSGIGIMDEQAREAEVWAVTITVDGDATLRLAGCISMDGHVNLKGAFEAWKRQEPMYAYDLAGDDLKQYLQAVVPPGYGLPAWEPGSSEAFPMRQWFDFFSFPEGALFVVDAAPLPEPARQVLRRLTDTFAFAYTRFLDLQQAEARAREAVRAASLDRVRAEIATMRTTDDLQRITPLIWRELTTLGVPFFRCGVIIIDEASEAVEMFLSNSYGKQLADLRLSFDGHAFIQNAVTAWRNRQVFADQWEQERLMTWVQFLLEGGMVDKAEDYMDRDGPPPLLALHLVPFAQGLLYVGAPEPLADDQVDLVQALADAFAVAYARYEDFKRLEAAKADVEATLDHLKTTQTQLIQSEKMASLGRLTAGIAHEIKNPLNFVNNFSQLSVELAEELRREIETHQDTTLADVAGDLAEILDDLKINAEKIHHHGARADGIVRSMMQHARGGEGERRATDVNALVEEYVNLAYHGMRASTPGFMVEIEREYDEAVGQVPVKGQELGRVLLNLLSNAFYAVDKHAGRSAEGYTPTVTVTTRVVVGGIEIRVSDNGPGIPAAVQAKIFEPFFTTKPTGTGTGLGLSLSYDIVTHGHGGTLSVESDEGEGATFIITLPNSLS